jgi:hypothetical protein
MAKKCLLLLACMALMTPLAAKAQSRGNIIVFGGYSYLNQVFLSKHGWNISIAGNVTRHVALVADFSGHYASNSWFQNSDRYSDYSLLFGPRYVHTIGKRWTPFAHVLIGNFRETQKSNGSPVMDDGSISGNWFALGIGGGLDIRMSNRISVRALQLDLIKLADRDHRDYYGRASFGAVFHLNGVFK